jgi:hypothetical protein
MRTFCRQFAYTSGLGLTFFFCEQLKDLPFALLSLRLGGVILPLSGMVLSHKLTFSSCRLLLPRSRNIREWGIFLPSPHLLPTGVSPFFEDQLYKSHGHGGGCETASI